MTTTKPTSGLKWPGLDHLRALAISMVFVFHYRLFEHPVWLDHFGRFGWTGVDLFFVLSGFLIAGQLFTHVERRKSLGLAAFYIKRSFRILPAYLVIVALYFTVPFFAEWNGLGPLWRYLTFTLNLDIRHTHTFSHAWSLCVEEQFYLTMPLILFCFLKCHTFKWSVYMLPLLFIAGLILRAYLWYHFVMPVPGGEVNWSNWSEYIYYPTYSRLDGLLVGISLAAIYQYMPVWKEHIQRNGNWFLLAGLALITGAFYLCIDQSSFTASVFGFPLIALAFGCIVAGAVSPSSVLHRLGTRVTGPLAVLSYSLYLSHKAVIHLTHTWVGIDPASTWMFVLSAVMCVAAALVMRYAVEKPFLRIRDRVLENRRPKPIPQAAHPHADVTQTR
jgi:peptidoglycan/LPS O-acetylase OafA/YrhL